MSPNDTSSGSAEPRQLCISRLFEEQAERTPDAVAVEFERAQLTYRELDERANQLAHRLRSLNVGPEVIVGLHVERSLETIVGMLGILKAGGAYVPLDPGYPRERLLYMLQDTGAPVLVTQRSLVNDLDTYRSEVVCLDTDTGIGRMSKERPAWAIAPETLLYVIYTSGSTGKPKGVMVDHATVARLFDAVRTHLDFDESDTWTLFHSCSFGFSVWEIWGALLHGGRLVVVPLEVTLSPASFYDLVCRQRVTVLSQTPSAFRLFLEADEALERGRDLELRLIVFSGEPLEPHLLSSWMERHGDERPRLINMYALTETGGEVAYRRLTTDDLSLASRSIIGVPLPHAEIHVLDEHMLPVPVETAGEMYIGGDAVARGYLKLPKLTAEKFVVNTLTGEFGLRFYRTGDRARYLPNGEIEFLGRLDDQVKILGYRIEPAEIEQTLSDCDGVAEAVVIAREDRPGDKRLVAYVVRERGRNEGRPSRSQRPSSVTALGLRQALQYRLPEYMIPSAFVFLGTLPLSPNGKIDRHVLPAPDRGRVVETALVAPRTRVEEELVGIWKEALNLDQVGVQDDFLMLGGNSLLAIQVLVRVMRDFSVELTLRLLLEVPTVAELAQVIETMRWAAEGKQRSTETTGAGREEGEI